MMASAISRPGQAARAGEQHSRVPTRRPADKTTALASHSLAAAPPTTQPSAQRTAAGMASTDAVPVPRTSIPSGLPQGPRSRIPSSSQPKIEKRSALRTPTPPTRPREPVAPRSEGSRSVSQMRSPPNTLRRKPSTIGAHAQSTREQRPASSGAGQHGVKVYKAPPLPTQLPAPPLLPAPQQGPREPTRATKRQAEEPTMISPQDLSVHDTRLPTPSFTAVSSSPSTRQSDSPGPWSRTSTPTSMSSHSPGLAVPAKWAPRPRTTSPGRRRPPVTWRGVFVGTDEDDSKRTDESGLPALRESHVSSSSSGSTIKATDRRRSSQSEKTGPKEAPGLEPKAQESRTAATLTRPNPMIPPPRKSSVRPNVQGSEPQHHAKPGSRTLEYQAASPPSAAVSSTESISIISRRPSGASPVRDGPPPRPSRDGAPNLGQLEDNPTIPVIQSNLSGLPFNRRRRGSSDTFSSSRLGSRKRAGTIPSPEPQPEPSEATGDDGKRSPNLFRAQTFPDVARSLGPSPVSTLR